MGFQMLAPLVSLSSLKVDKLIAYKNMRATIPKITALGLTTKTWNCTFIQNIAAIINVENITLNFNAVATDTSLPACDLKSSAVNKITKPAFAQF